jgi:transposase-like protein
VAQNYLTGGTLHSLARQHDLSRNPIRIWIQEFEGGAFDDEAAAVDTTRPYEARRRAGAVRRQGCPESSFLKGL